MGLDQFQNSNSNGASRSGESAHNAQYSDNELIQLLQQFDEEEKENLSKKNFTKHNDYPSGPTVTTRFGSWNAALEEAGLETNVDSKWNGKYVDKDTVKEQLHKFVEEEEESLTYENFDDNKEYPSSKVVGDRFGTWNEGLEAAGIGTNRELHTIDVTDDMFEVSADKAYVMGVLMGDGCVDVANSMVLSVTDKDFAEEYARRFCSWTGLVWDGFDSDKTQVGCNVQEKYTGENHNDQYVVKKGVTEIEAHVRQYKYPNSSKSIVDEFGDYKTELLRGLWDSEGYIKDDGRVGFSNGHGNTFDIFTDLVTSTIDVNYSELTITEYDRDYRVCLIPHRYTQEFIDAVSPTIQRKIDKFDDIDIEPRDKRGATDGWFD